MYSYSLPTNPPQTLKVTAAFQLSQLTAGNFSTTVAQTTGARPIPVAGHIREKFGPTGVPNTLRSPGGSAYPSFRAENKAYFKLKVSELG